MKTKRKNDDRRVYHTSNHLIFLHVLMHFAVICILIMFILVADHSFPFLFNLLSMILCLMWMGFILWKSYWVVYGNRFIVTEAGLGFFIFGKSGFTAWDNLQAIHFQEGSSDKYGIQLKEPISIEKSPIRVGRTNETYIDLEPIIPLPTKLWRWLGVNWDKFAKTDFGLDLQHYAPQLFKGKLKIKPYAIQHKTK